MDTHINHAYMRIKICIANDQNEWMRTWAANSNALSRNGISAQLMNTKYNPCISECETKLKRNTLGTIIDSQKGIKHRAPNKAPIYCSRINLMNPVFLELWRNYYCLCKIEKIRRLFRNWNVIKNYSNENWIIGAYLKIGVFGIKFWRLELRWLNRNLLKKMRNEL